MAEHELDFVARMIAKRTAKNPAFPQQLAEATERRKEAEERAARRTRLGLTEASAHIDAHRVLPFSKQYQRKIAGAGSVRTVSTTKAPEYTSNARHAPVAA